MSLAAWRAAVDVASRLARRRGARAVAVTGSLARGAFCDGSDVDLWFLGGRCRSFDVVADGVVVSVLETDAAFEASDALLWRFEVAAAVALVDDDGAFAALRRRAHDDAAAIRAAWIDASHDGLRFLAGVAQTARSSALRAAALREWARRVAALRVLVERGWRVPRFRDFVTVFGRVTARRIEQALALPDAAGLGAALAAARRDGDVVDGMPLPQVSQVRRYLAADRAFDAVVAVRQGLPPAPRARRLTPAQRALFCRVHGDGCDLERQRELCAAVAAAVDARGLGVDDVGG